MRVWFFLGIILSQTAFAAPNADPKLVDLWSRMDEFHAARGVQRAVAPSALKRAAPDPALDALSQNGIVINALRIRGFPFQDEIFDFVASHSKVFVVEQNRDAQLKTLLVNDAGINPANLISLLHYDGTPITARFITKEITEIVSALNVRPIKKDKAA